MIKFYINRELSEKLGIKLSKFKRWSREFLPPDPLGGLQSGYARQYTLEQAFLVYLGGHLVADLHFPIPETKQIIKDLGPWINLHKTVVSGNKDERKFQEIQVYIHRHFPDSSRGVTFAYKERKQIIDEPYEQGPPDARHAVYVEHIIPVGTRTEDGGHSDTFDKMDSRIVYLSRLYDRFMDRMS
jgi:hypothetical protein